jgi:hypothetical protein
MVRWTLKVRIFGVATITLSHSEKGKRDERIDHYNAADSYRDLSAGQTAGNGQGRQDSGHAK